MIVFWSDLETGAKVFSGRAWKWTAVILNFNHHGSLTIDLAPEFLIMCRRNIKFLSSWLIENRLDPLTLNYVLLQTVRQPAPQQIYRMSTSRRLWVRKIYLIPSLITML